MTKDEARDAAAKSAFLADNGIGAGQVNFEKGFDAGYEAAVAAERSRIIAELEEKIILTLAGTVANMGWNDGVKAAIEIVKGGDER